MKHLLLVLTSAIICVSTVFAQNPIIFNSTDLPANGTTIKRNVYKPPLPTPGFGNAGVNQVWDFSSLANNAPDSVKLINVPSGKQATFPNANTALTSDNVKYLYIKNNSSLQDIEGFTGYISGIFCDVNFSYPSASSVNITYQFPTQYNGTYSGTYGFRKVFPSPQLDNNYDVRVTVTTNYTCTVDGWGKTITPVGAYKSLRIKRVETTTTNVEADVTFVGWQDANGYPKTTTTTHYAYIAKESKGPVVSFDYDSLNNLIDIAYSLVKPALCIANFKANSGGAGLVNFVDSTDGYPTTYSWTFGDGSGPSSSQNPNHTYTANGAYQVCLTVTNPSGSNTHCDSVHISGIGGVNHAPVAGNDTFNVLQDQSRLYHVAANDVDPDNNTICISSVWGSSRASFGGSCDGLQYTHSADSLFTGYDTAYYKLCDNGTPVLCDTGRVIIKVTKNPALLPTANLNLQCSSTHDGLEAILLTSTSLKDTGTAHWLIIEKPLASCPDSIYHLSGHTVNFTPRNYCGDSPDSILIWVVVSNKFGKDTSSGSYCYVLWEGINEAALTGVKLYPNPTSSTLTIDMRNNQDEITRNYSTIEIFNTLGQRQKQINGNAQSQLVNIPVSDLAQGMYVVTISDPNGTRRTLGRFSVAK